MPKIDPWIHRKIVVLNHNTPVHQAARVMRDHEIGSVMVSDHQGHIVGILTDRDLVIRVLAENRRQDTPLSAVMTSQPESLDESAETHHVIDLMTRKRIRRVPILERTPKGVEKCIGMVTLDDLIASQSIDLGSLMQIVRGQVLIQPVGIHLVRSPGEDEKNELKFFFQKISDRIRPKAEFKPGQIEEVTEIVMSALVRRLHHTGAQHLIHQLPQLLQDELIRLQRGPDDSITVPRIVSDLVSRFNLDEATAYMILIRIGMVLEEWIQPKELDHVKAQLPLDFRALFAVRGVLKRKSKG